MTTNRRDTNAWLVCVRSLMDCGACRHQQRKFRLDERERQVADAGHPRVLRQEHHIARSCLEAFNDLERALVLEEDCLNTHTFRKRSRHVGSDTAQLAGRRVLAELGREQSDTELASAHEVWDARV